MLQSIFDSAQRGDFADSDPSQCGCRGGGWFLSEVDTWHKCPVHYLGQPDPYSDGESLGTKGWQQFSIEVRRFEVEDADEDGPYVANRFHVVAKQKATGIKIIHREGYEDKYRTQKLMIRVAKSGRAFSQLDSDLWVGPKAWQWPESK